MESRRAPLSEVDRFKSKAEQCRHAAAQTVSELDRSAWLRLAAEWEKLAETALQKRGIFERYDR